MTMRGLDEDDFREVGAIMCETMRPDADFAALTERAGEFVRRRRLYPGLNAFPSFSD